MSLEDLEQQLPPLEDDQMEEDLKEDPMAIISRDDLEIYIKHIHEKRFKPKGRPVTEAELLKGAFLAKNFNNHAPIRNIVDLREQDDSNSIDEIGLLSPEVWVQVTKCVDIQHSKKLWNEPKDLLITITACCMASLTQGWDQVANGNLGWPKEFKLRLEPNGTGKDIWILGGANAITWFAAAVFGCAFMDPICHATPLGRRGAVFIAALLSCASVIGGSQATSWQGYLISRMFLGIGIGAKAAIVPIWESEVLPKGKRGRLLVLWQVFVATGIFAGSVATYIFRNNWRNQVLSGAIPAFTLAILTYTSCESPRWLVLKGKYYKAFESLLRLRKNRELALEELCFIHFQVQAERAVIKKEMPPNYKNLDPYVGYRNRVWNIITLHRNQRAALATFVVMISQQLSGINILAFLASIFFSAADLRTQPDLSNEAARDAFNEANATDSLRLTIGFGVANSLFSMIAYFLIERKKKTEHSLPPDVMLPPGEKGIATQDKAPNAANPGAQRTKTKFKLPSWLQLPLWVRGRRSLLLTSLAGGTVMLLILALLLDLPSTNKAKEPAVIVFIIIFTLFYSPGAGAVPFAYSAEVWPNEGREIGMSWSVFWNFIGAGLLALLVPRCLQWGAPRLFGLFTGLSFFGFVLVWFLVPEVGVDVTLEEMSRKFEDKTWVYSKKKARALIGRKGKPTARKSLAPLPGEGDTKLPTVGETPVPVSPLEDTPLPPDTASTDAIAPVDPTPAPATQGQTNPIPTINQPSLS